MSKRRDIERRLHNLGEIGEIMTAMRNLATIELHRLTRRQATQRRLAESVGAAVAEFLAFHPQAAQSGLPGAHACVLLGSERGFCGDFNPAIVQALAAQPWSASEPALIAIGSRLATRLESDPRLVAWLEGAGTLEQVDRVLLFLMQALEQWRSAHAPGQPLTLTVLHHPGDTAAVVATRLDPRGLRPAVAPRNGHAPLLNLEPQAFFSRLTQHYLLAALQQICCGSLTAENRARVQHMDAAVRRIEERTAPLLLARNSLRQEEITEEIEVIMLNVET